MTEWSPCFLYLNCVIPLKSSEPLQAINTVIYSIIRELKKRRRQRVRQKAIGLGWQNNNFARASRFFCSFLCRHCMSTTWLCLISRFLGDVNTSQKLPFSFPGLWYSQFYNSTTKKQKKTKLLKIEKLNEIKKARQSLRQCEFTFFKCLFCSPLFLSHFVIIVPLCADTCRTL